ncbi:aspartate kinase [Oceanispirochaeta sp.]|jgi:aspartokinase/homoserine dehydrogenase 1|uniref:aspartate kinase n=1 Tax=Oceanispirochaeta sp. TaxID=2035350 RepID=UPI002603DD42|nr:aspartate kinase [Oceanispirochaeta sp.]MDA3957193.1 aspartate kinase [Oceanispirochaeta sp.]
MNVKKFGGSSLADAGKIKQTVEIVKQNKDTSLCLVLSAMKGVTNTLVEAAQWAESGDKKYQNNIEKIRKKHLDCVNDLFIDPKPEGIEYTIESMFVELNEILHGVELVRECSAKTMDLIMSFGERLNCYQVTAYLNHIGINARYIDSRDIIKTDSAHGKGNVDFKKTYERIQHNLIDIESSIPVICGFIASDDSDRTTTLGRNGSDYTASIIGAALNADRVEIWTDVDGVLTADPRVVKNAFVIPQLSIEEAMELSFFGAEVIHPYTLIPTTDKNIPVYIKNTLNPSAEGTVITSNFTKKDRIITGIASIDDLSLINIEGGGMMGMPGMASQIFMSLSDADVNIIMITQASSEHSISILCRSEETDAAVKMLNKNLKSAIHNRRIQNIQIVDQLVIIAVIGENMKGQAGLTGKLFSAVGDANINILAIAQGSSERNISFVIQQKDRDSALIAVHKKFIG